MVLAGTSWNGTSSLLQECTEPVRGSMKKHSVVIVSLHSPREKVWGVLVSILPSGITLRGIDLNSFDDWSREVARGEATMGLSTVFFPMQRVERILLDENVGGIEALAQVFESRVGTDLWTYLGLERPESTDRIGAEASGDEPHNPEVAG